MAEKHEHGPADLDRDESRGEEEALIAEGLGDLGGHDQTHEYHPPHGLQPPTFTEGAQREKLRLRTHVRREALGEDGWLKALKVSEYGLRMPQQMRASQRRLFPLGEAL